LVLQRKYVKYFRPVTDGGFFSLDRLELSKRFFFLINGYTVQTITRVLITKLTPISSFLYSEKIQTFPKKPSLRRPGLIIFQEKKLPFSLYLWMVIKTKEIPFCEINKTTKRGNGEKFDVSFLAKKLRSKTKF